MTPLLPLAARRTPPPLVLVADDDARVLELLQIALANQHWRVVTAADGDEAIRRALAERPDVAVLDVRMPRKSGLEVCDYLRHDPEDPHVPIVLVSGTGDTDARIEGLMRGADDFLSKPFSPKELIARVQRLLARAGETRAQRRRNQELERELSRAQGEARRAQGEAKRAQRLRAQALTAGRELSRSLDVDDLHDRVLALVQRTLGGAEVALLAPDFDHTTEAGLVAQAFRADPGTGLAAARLAETGELARVLGALGRPAGREELARLSELRAELAPLSAAGVALFAPLRSGSGLEAVLVAGERPDGNAFAADDLEALSATCDLAAVSLQNARRFRVAQDRAIELVAERATPRDRDRRAIAEGRALADDAARRLALPPRERALVRHAVSLGAWGWSDRGREVLEELRGDDPTSRLERLQELVARGESLEVPPEASAEERRAMLVTAAGVRYATMRASGRSAFESGQTALEWTGVGSDAVVAEALERALDACGAHAHAAA